MRPTLSTAGRPGNYPVISCTCSRASGAAQRTRWHGPELVRPNPLPTRRSHGLICIVPAIKNLSVRTRFFCRFEDFQFHSRASSAAPTPPAGQSLFTAAVRPARSGLTSSASCRHPCNCWQWLRCCGAAGVCQPEAAESPRQRPSSRPLVTHHLSSLE